MREILEALKSELDATEVAPGNFRQARQLAWDLLDVEIPMHQLEHVYHLTNVVAKAQAGPPFLQPRYAQVRWSQDYVDKAYAALSVLMAD